MNSLQNKKLFAFDVDGTLTESRVEISEASAIALIRLLLRKRVAIITGGNFERISEQLLRPIETVGQNKKLNIKWENLTLLPTNGGGFYIFNRKWIELKSHKLKIEEKEKIIQALSKIDREDPELANNTPYGEEIQDRGSEITYSALGNTAPLDLKRAWDPDFKKRLAITEKLRELLPEFEVKIGGTTSIDITARGMDKAFAIKSLMKEFSLNKKDIVFYGDAVYPNGNDYPVLLMGIDTIKVTSPIETQKSLEDFLAK